MTYELYHVVGTTGILLKPYCVRYFSQTIKSVACFFIPAGFRWNGANIPKIVQWLFGTPFDEIHAIPSMKHDAFYEGIVNISRFDADLIYLNDILDNGQNIILAVLEWLNVRLFGWKYWNKYTVYNTL